MSSWACLIVVLFIPLVGRWWFPCGNVVVCFSVVSSIYGVVDDPCFVFPSFLFRFVFAVLVVIIMLNVVVNPWLSVVVDRCAVFIAALRLFGPVSLIGPDQTWTLFEGLLVVWGSVGIIVCFLGAKSSEPLC